MRRLGWFAMFVAAVCLVAACGGSSGGDGTGGDTGSPSGGRTGGTIIWGKPGELVGRDPHASFNGVDWELYGQVYEGLTAMGNDLKVEPALAESWEQPTPTKYVFRLRAAKFSNGRTVEASDVVGSLKRVQDPDTAAFWVGNLGPIEQVAAVDERTVEIDLKKPYTPLLAALAHPGASVLPMKELDDGSFEPKKEFLGTGPWQEVSHLPDQQWTFKRNPNHWRTGFPRATELIVKIIKDDSARTAALRSGTVNIATFENPDAAKLLSGIPGAKTIIQPTTDYYRMDAGAVNRKSKLYDQTVRQALNMALDREQILKLALGNIGEVSPPISPGQSKACQASLGSDYYKRNLEKAKQLLQSVGASNLRFELIASPAFAQFPAIAQVIQRNFAEIGVKVDILQLELGAWLKREFESNPSQMDAALSYNAGFGDPGSNLNNYSPKFLPDTKGWYKPDSTLDALLERVNELPNGGERDKAMQSACARINETSNEIPLVTRPKIIGYIENRLKPVFQGTEGYVDPLRYSDRFTVSG